MNESPQTKSIQKQIDALKTNVRILNGAIFGACLGTLAAWILFLMGFK